MRRTARLLAALLALAPLPGAAEEARYELFFGGVRAGELSWQVTRDGPRYAARAEARAANWVAALYRARLTAEGEGEGEAGAAHVGQGRTAAGPRPARFAVSTRFGSDAQDVTVHWGPDGAPLSVAADPPWKPRAWEVEPAAQAGAADPIAAAVALLAPQPPEALCDAAREVFDGRRVTRIAFGPPEPKDGGWRCEGEWSRVAGFRPRDLAKPPTPLRVDYVRFPDGLARAVRIEVATGWGLAVAHRLPSARAAAKD